MIKKPSIANCRSVKIVQFPKNGLLGGPHNVKLDMGNGFTVTISQMGCRESVIVSEHDANTDQFHSCFRKLDKLLMLCEGSFIPIEQIIFLDKDENTCHGSSEMEEFWKGNALSYYTSRDVFLGSANKLCEFYDVVNSRVFVKWKRLLDKLEIVHQIVLYSMANTGLPAELALAFLIQTFEPLYEYLAQINNYPMKNSQGDEIPLKSKLEKTIIDYGMDIFGEEFVQDKSYFLKRLKNSRVRIMHIKRKYKEPFFTGEEALAYMGKMSLLYRHTLLQVIGIDYEIYKQHLIDSVTYYNQFLPRQIDVDTGLIEFTKKAQEVGGNA